MLYSFLHIVLLLLISVILCFKIILIRGAYPRFRYDMLMNLTWKNLLPINIIILLLNILLQ